jgi:hypothetical protein
MTKWGSGKKGLEDIAPRLVGLVGKFSFIQIITLMAIIIHNQASLSLRSSRHRRIIQRSHSIYRITDNYAHLGISTRRCCMREKLVRSTAQQQQLETCRVSSSWYFLSLYFFILYKWHLLTDNGYECEQQQRGLETCRYIFFSISFQFTNSYFTNDIYWQTTGINMYDSEGSRRVGTFFFSVNSLTAITFRYYVPPLAQMITTMVMMTNNVEDGFIS